MRRDQFILTLAMTGALFLGACAQHGPQKNASNDPINGTGWLLQEVNGRPPHDTQVTLNFEDGTLHGSDGCNRYSGPYTLDGKKIAVTRTAGTMMACPDTIMQQASAYMAALSQANAYEVRGQALTLLNSKGETLASFTRKSLALGGTSWTVTAYNNGKQAVVSVLAGSTLSAEFGTEGKVGGSAGCNRYSASYQAAAMQLSISPPASTRRMCADIAGLMEQEARFLAALQAATSYRIDGDKLEMRRPDGAIAILGTRASP